MKTWVLPTVLALVAVGCVAAPPPESVAPPSHAPSAPASTTSPPSAATSTKAAPSALATATRPLIEVHPPMTPRFASGGSTRGTIACGGERCDARKQACSIDPDTEIWSCVDASKPGTGEEGMFRSFCDDASDCRPGQQCCLIFGTASRYARYCTRQGDDLCQAELCLDDGAPCPRGTTCVHTPDPHDEQDPKGVQGECIPPKGPASCGDGRRCPEDQPYCIITANGSACTTRNTDEYERTPIDDRYQCTRQSDCSHGEVCSYATGEHFRQIDALCSRWVSGAIGTLVCDPREPNRCPPRGLCRRDMWCKPSGRFPWMGLWVTRE